MLPLHSIDTNDNIYVGIIVAVGIIIDIDIRINIRIHFKPVIYYE